MTEISESLAAAGAKSGAEANLVGGRYWLLEVIGAGGMGRVWLAEDELLRRKVAVKEISASESLDIQLYTMREARAAARLDHPGVVKVFDVVWQPDRSWIVMEYVKSRSLQQVLVADGPLSHQEAARIGLRMLEALRAAHAAGVLHRDVKPHNVLLAEDGRVVLSDFGLAAMVADGDGSSEPVIGSPHYLAPERLQPGASDASADLWSLGATLYAATEGRPPFARPTIPESLANLQNEEPDPAQNPGPLSPVIRGLLVKEPGRRLTASELEPRLRRIAESAVLPARGSARVVTAPVRATRRRSKVAAFAVAGTAVAVLGAAGVAFAVQDQKAAPAAPETAAAAVTAPTVAAVPLNPCGFDAATTDVVAATSRIPAGLPVGWKWFRDPTGFTLGLPSGWRRSAAGTVVCFTDPAGTRSFTVDSSALVTRQPLAYWASREKAAVTGKTVPGYRRISMDVLLLKRGGADWEYTWKPDSDTTQHVRRILLATGVNRSYSLQWVTADADWAKATPLQRQFVAYFQFAA